MRSKNVSGFCWAIHADAIVCLSNSSTFFSLPCGSLLSFTCRRCCDLCGTWQRQKNLRALFVQAWWQCGNINARRVPMVTMQRRGRRWYIYISVIIWDESKGSHFLNIARIIVGANCYPPLAWHGGVYGRILPWGQSKWNWEQFTHLQAIKRCRNTQHLGCTNCRKLVGTLGRSVCASETRKCISA